jgi:hypothetical protein
MRSLPIKEIDIMLNRYNALTSSKKAHLKPIGAAQASMPAMEAIMPPAESEPLTEPPEEETPAPAGLETAPPGSMHVNLECEACR